MIKATYLMPHPPILIPEVGNGSEEICTETLNSLDIISKEIKDLSPDTIVLITPHGPVFSDGIAIGYEENLYGNLKQFAYEDIKIAKKNNRELVDKIVYESGKINLTCLKLDKESASYYGVEYELDHGTIVPLYFVDKNYSDYNLVHITYGLFSSEKLYEFGNLIKNCIESMNEDAVVIASGDMSHRLLDKGPYDFHKSGPLFDEKISKSLLSKDILDTLFIDEDLIKEASECGKRSIDIMLGCLDGYDYDVKELSYEGPFGVGYLVTKFNYLDKDSSREYIERISLKKSHIETLIRENESNYVKLARRAIESYLGVLNGQILEDTMPTEMFEARAGVFVSLKKHGALRGCIGTIGPTEDNIALEVISNAVKAGFEDPRFPELEVDELKELTITVDVLLQPMVVDDIKYLDVNKYGIIVSTEYKRGLLLPNLEGIDTVEEQLRIAKHKGSITDEESYTLERFEVVRYY